jgi:type III secretion protein D
MLHTEATRDDQMVGAVLRVTSGMHRGAQVSLQRPAMVVLGCGDDCDLILMDAGVASRHAALMLHEHTITVRALEGDVAVNDRALVRGKSSAIQLDTPLTIGGASFVIEEASVSARGSATDAAHDDVEGAQITPRNKRLNIAASVVFGCIVAGALLASSLVPDAERHHRSADERMTAVLSQLGLQEAIQSTTASDGSITLSGTTPDEASHTALLQALAKEGLTPVLQVTSRERVIADVKNVFRVNGMDVDATYEDAGVVSVKPLSLTQYDIDRVIQHAVRDVRGLKEIRIAGKAPTQPALARPIDAAAKRVVSVVAGSPAYVVTADGARYFVGALLPQGQRLVAINGSSLTLERNGEQLEMKF